MSDVPETQMLSSEMHSDPSIRSHVDLFLQANPEVDHREVRVNVQDGVVTLSGTVDAVPEKRRAREVAETTPGVQRVIDDLQVRNFVARSDDELKSELVNALTRDAYVESLPTLEIYVSDGEVRLEGTCKTWRERHAIADAVWWTPGVRNVENLVHPLEDHDTSETANHNLASL
ncbi:MAG TPA: BON domain-containing protein [Armatimonadota bacterium]|jgi:osmotically-inducible protein OsmY